jgi:glycosyltransferase involved in cell wall biosynthesis
MMDNSNILVVIPAYNEEKTVGRVVAQVREAARDADILVIDDGSEDETSDVARKAGAFAVRLVGNLGIGAAVQTGFILAHQMGYPLVARVDADGQHNPAVLPKLIASLEEESADVVVGSRFLERGHAGTSFPRRVGSRLLGALISAITGQKVTDPTSGMQVLNRDALAFCADHYPYDYPEPESRVLLHRAGFRVKEVPVVAAPRVTGRSSIGVLDSAYYMVRVTIAVLVELLRPPRRERKSDAKS